MTIRRPLYYISIAFAAAILGRHYFGAGVAGGMAAGLAIVWRMSAGSGRRSWMSVRSGGAGWQSGGRERLGMQRRAVLPLMILLSFSAGLASVLICDHHLAADPVRACYGQEAVMVGIVRQPEYYRDSKGQRLVRIETELQAIGEERVGKGASRVLLTADLEGAGDSGAGSAGKGDSGAGSGDKGDSGAGSAGQGDSGAGSAGTSDAGTGMSLSSFPPGSVIRFSGELKEPEGKRNPNCFDYKLYLKTRGIQATVRTKDLEVLALRLRGLREWNEGAGRVAPNGVPTLAGRLFLLRERYLERIEANAGEETAGLIRAMLFGQKGELDDDVEEVFQQNGTAHILAVSGLHVGMLYGAACLLWDLLAGMAPGAFGARRGKRFFVTMVVLFTGYTFLAGYSPSVVRAVAMVLLHAFAKMTGRRYDLPCAAFAVGIIALARNPYILLQAGFQMSFLAVLTLGLITPYVHRVYSGALAGSIAIQVGLGPYMMYQFNILPLGAVLINVPVIFLAGLLVPAGMVGMFLPGGATESGNESGAAVAAAAAQAGPAQAEAVASGNLIAGQFNPGQFIAGVWDQGVASLCGAMIRLNELCSAGRITSMDVASPPIWVLGIFYLGLLVFASEEGRLMIMRRRRRLIRSLVIGVLVSSIAFGQVADDGFRRADLVFVDVGQGDCMHLRIKSWTGQVRYNVLIDGGGKADFDLGKKTLKPYLLKNGARRIDLAIVTHLHTDHYDGIRSLARMGMVRKICVYEGYRPQEQEILKECGLAREDLIYVTAGDEIRLGSARFEFLAPPARSDEEYAQMAADEEDENKKSLLIKVAICGVSAMMTGDIDEDGEREAMGAAGMAGAERGQQGAAGSRSDKAAPQGDQDSQTAPSLHCDILKVGHHGSKTSSCEEFLDAVGPAFAVIQVGKNNMYGHPTPEVLQRLAIREIPVYRNDLQGAVGMEIKGGRVKKVRTMLEDQ